MGERLDYARPPDEGEPSGCRDVIVIVSVYLAILVTVASIAAMWFWYY
jgi:hypothetical protein